MQNDDSGGRELRLLRYEQISRHAKVGRGLKGEVLLDIVASVRAADHFSSRGNRRGRVKKMLEYFGPRRFLPRLQIPKLGPQEGKLQSGAVGLPLDERIQAADVRSGPCGFYRGLCERRQIHGCEGNRSSGEKTASPEPLAKPATRKRLRDRHRS